MLKMQPISRAQFNVAPESIEQVIDQIVRWMKKRSGVALPDRAFSGEPFQTGLDAKNPALAVRTEIDGQVFWAGKLRVSDSDVPGRTWHTELVVCMSDQPSVAVRLAMYGHPVDMRAHPQLVTCPGIIRQLVDNVGAMDGCIPLLSTPSVVTSIDDFSKIALSDDRAVPLLMFAEEAVRAWPEPVRAMSEALAGLMHTRIMPEGLSYEIENEFSRAFTVFGRCAKLYFPIFDANHFDPYSHPLLRLDDYSMDDFRAKVIGLAARARAPHSGQLPRFSALQLLSQPSHAEGVDSSVWQVEMQQRIEDLQAENADFEDALDEAAAAERDNNAKIKKLEGRVEDLELDISALSEIMSTAAMTKVPKTAPPLRRRAGVELWCDVTGAGHIVVTDAFRDSLDILPENEDYLFRFALALHGIAELTAGIRSLTGKNIPLGMGVELCPVGNTEGFDAYNFQHDGRHYRSDWHAKWGSGRDIRAMFRIYYRWDTAGRKAILHQFGTHLDNWSTN